MATRRRRIPNKRARQLATQTRQREIIVAQSVDLYVRQVDAMQSEAQRLIEAWIAENSFEALRGLQDAGEQRLLRQLRGVFDAPKNMRRFFGRLAGLIDRDVVNTLDRTIPTINRAKLIESSPRALEAYAKRNAELIKNVGDMTTERIAKVMREGAAGRHTDALTNAFTEAFDVSRSRARLWARDQTLKLHGQITRERHKQVGIDRYYWTDSNDERVREIHADLGERSDRGETFSYEEPPIIAVGPERRGNPGDDYECRCTAYPAL